MILRRIFASLTLAAACLSAPAWADVELRVEARPIGEPIEAFVTVTDTNGDPVTGLTAADFSVTLDGAPLPLAPSNLTLPPSEDPNQKVSVLFVMDYTTSVTNVARDAMEQAVIAFIDAMNAGDQAAILKFNDDTGAEVVQAFTAIDDGGANDLALHNTVLADYPGDGSNILDAVEVAVEHFATQLATLPPGPKAIILVTDGIDNASTATLDEAIAAANGSSIPVFAIGVANPDQAALDLMTELAVDTGGQFILAPSDPEIADAYVSIQFLLTSEYLLSFDSAIDDCEEHTLAVTVDPHGSAEATFTRRECDTTPDAFSFASRTGLDPDTGARSEEITITGLEGPAPISVETGTYSIGCGDTFTRDDGTINDGETVCVRHTTSVEFSTSKTTTLTIGGVSATFTTTTHAEGSGGGGGGGGGSTGLLELLLGLGLLLMRPRRAN